MFRAQILAFSLGSIVLAGQLRADDLDRIKAQSDLKAQKLIADVNAALAKSRTLEPAEARELLRSVLGRLEDDLTLTERQRSSLVQQVRKRLRVLIQAARAQEEAEVAAAKKEIAQTRTRNRTTDRSTGGERQNKGPSDTAKDFYKGAKDRLQTAKDLKNKKAKNLLDAQAEIDRSASQMMEQRITPRFLAATERRQQKLTAKEKALLKMLNSTLSVDFKDTTLKEALEFIQEKTNNTLPIFLDEGSLKEANIESNEPVNFKIRKATVRTILKKILADKGLTYVIKEAAIQVVTPEKARQMMVVRTYPIGDLMGAPNPLFDPFGFQQLAAVNSLINVIKSSIDPSIWEQGGSITFFPPGSLIIRGPAEMHYQMGFGGGYGRRD
jgi:hypothetical protein